MNNIHQHHIQAAIQLTEQMLAMADNVAKSCEDDGALVIFSVIRDSAHKIRRIADKENEKTKNENMHLF